MPPGICPPVENTVSKRIKFVVSIDVPDGVSIREMLGYIKEAVVFLAKTGDPDGPLFDLCDRNVSVKRFVEKTVKEP